MFQKAKRLMKKLTSAKKKMQMDGIGWYEYFRYPYTGGVL